MSAASKNGVDELHPEAIVWYDALRTLLSPYEPAATAAEADTLFSTPEIRQSLETHYLADEGDSEAVTINGIQLVQQIEGLGFRFENTGDLQFHWLMKKKT